MPLGSEGRQGTRCPHVATTATLLAYRALRRQARLTCPPPNAPGGHKAEEAGRPRQPLVASDSAECNPGRFLCEVAPEMTGFRQPA